MPCCGFFPLQSRVDSFHSVAQCCRFCFGLSVVGRLLKCLVSWWGCLALPLRAELRAELATFEAVISDAYADTDTDTGADMQI